MSTYVDKPISLIEKKKQQWAKEREELARLSSPWNINESQSFEAPFQRIKYVSKLATQANNEQFFRKDCTTNSSTRRSSLPPLYKNQYNSIDRDKEMGGETSGYGSDNPHQFIENIQSNPAWNSGYESSSSYKDDNRPKWKDKTPGGKFWDTKENDPPNWVKRGLQRDEEIIVSNTSPAESPQQEYGSEQERPYTSSTTSNNNNRTHIRGQNIPVDHAELAERERRRQIALAHQEAIRQQLEERDRIKREEKERRIKEEQEEELRIEREQEIERQRKENELRTLQEKQQRERKREEAIKEALEFAEKKAKLEKIKLKNKKNTVEEDINLEKNVDRNIHNNIEKEKVDNEQKQKIIIVSPRQEVINNDLKSTEQVKALSPRIDRSSTPNDGKNNNCEKNKNFEKNNNSDSMPPSSVLSQFFTSRENVPIMLHTSSIEVLQNMQYAVLMTGMGAPGTPSIPIAIPMSMSSTNTTPRTENRILTPTLYRNKTKCVCDIGTQTEDIDNNNNQRFIREKFNDLPLNYDNRNRLKDNKRARSEEERPKWGANRPPTRYMKQSEKDPFFQRRKPRQKTNDSSDESQTGSPRGYRKQYSDRKHTRSLWRKKDHFFTRNVRMYQTELVPLENDKDQIYYKPICECCCKCSKADILRIDENNSPRKLYLPECNDNSIENSSYLMDKNWESRTPSLSSSTRNTENL